MVLIAGLGIELVFLILWTHFLFRASAYNVLLLKMWMVAWFLIFCVWTFVFSLKSLGFSPHVFIFWKSKFYVFAQVYLWNYLGSCLLGLEGFPVTLYDKLPAAALSVNSC